MKQYTIFFLFLIAGSLLSSVDAKKERFLKKEKTEIINEKIQEERETAVQDIAMSIAAERDKKRIEQIQKEQEKIAHEKIESILRLEAEVAKKRREQDRKSRQQEQFYVRKAKVQEKQRRKRIVLWQNYMSKKKAAQLLIKEISRLDTTKKLHVTELKKEVALYKEKYSQNNFEKYPELVTFLLSQ